MPKIILEFQSYFDEPFRTKCYWSLETHLYSYVKRYSMTIHSNILSMYHQTCVDPLTLNGARGGDENDFQNVQMTA